MKNQNRIIQNPVMRRRSVVSGRARAVLRMTLAGMLLATTGANAAVLIGNRTISFYSTGVAVGEDAISGGMDAVTVGESSWAAGNNSTALGSHAVAMGDASTALGDSARANESQSLAIGANSTALFANSIALGSGSITLFGAQTGYTAFGLSAPQTSSGEVNVGNRTISGVAPGRDDQDAVNVGQLKAVASRIDGTVAYDRRADSHAANSIDYNNVTLQGDAEHGGTQIHNVADGIDPHDAVNLGQVSAMLGDAVGNITVNTSNPMFSAEGSPATDSALAAGTHSVAAGAKAVASGTGSVALGANTNASADNAVALGQGSVADRANTVSVGAAGQERQITNVAAGVQGTDAVNVDQLNQSTGKAKAYTDDQVRSARKDSYGGAAAAIAMAGLPQAVLPGHGMVALAAGTYGGQSAMALGVSQLSDSGKWAYKLQGTASTRGELGASIGAGMHF